MTTPSEQPSPGAAAGTPSEPEGKSRGFWRRRVLDPILAQLTQGITPEKIALTCAVGSACALFPILGTTTALCITAAILLKLNQPIIHIINQLLWIAYFPVMYGCIRFGETLLGAPPVDFDIARMSDLFWNSPGAFLEQFGLTALHAVLAWCVLAPVAGAIIYAVTLPLTRRAARRKTPLAP
jgi:uncharacterized protein (DUF2062 family)